MKSNSGMIKEFYHTEISLFKELLDCISLERENLINMEVKSLWEVMEDKSTILKSIEDSRQRFGEIIDTKNPYARLPREEKKIIGELKKTLLGLREEIRVMVKENVSFINETLVFFNDMISIFTASGSFESVYGPAKNSRTEISNLIYHNEV
ncbi:flagellar export chaperone FlgN [Thermodesulfobacteriota bacterium]